MKHLEPDIMEKILGADISGSTGSGFPRFAGLSIDSRTVKQGELFFAIKGENNDGHNYIAEALRKGAAGVVINRDRVDEFASALSSPLYAVDDTHDALLDLAAYIRRQSDATFGAITGSNGKTTTKEMLYAIISRKYRAFRSPGNLNNLFGLPISLGMMPDDVEYAVFELGISEPGEMTRLASVIKPELALFTNIGQAHLEILETVEQIVAAKFELVEKLPVGAIVVLNADDPMLVAEAKRRHIDYVGFGLQHPGRFGAEKVRFCKDGGIEFVVDGHQIRLPLFGRANVYNALAAITAAGVWGAEPEDWRAGLESFTPVEMRSVIEEFNGVRLILDCYNANPSSMKEGLQALSICDVPGKRIAVLGDMLELGKASSRLHHEIGEVAAASKLDHLLCIGKETAALAEGALAAGMSKDRVLHSQNNDEIIDRLSRIVTRGDVVFFKGSRGMQLEKIVTGLKGTVFSRN